MCKNFASPHVHVQSLDTASTPAAFALREAQLETGYLTVTDHGTMAACREVYDLCESGTGLKPEEKKLVKGKIKPILGLEGYFRDDDCDILQSFDIPLSMTKDGKRTYADYNKYFHLTFHCLDQHGYETLARVLSRADDRAEKHGAERKPLFGWHDLEEIGAANVTMTSGCLIGMVQRHLMNKDGPRHDIAEAYLKRLLGLCKPGNFYTEIFPHKCDENWDSGVYFQVENLQGERFEYKAATWNTFMTDKGGKMKADDIAKMPEFRVAQLGSLVQKMVSRKFQEIEPLKLISAEKREGFIKNDCTPYAPNGDVQLGGNIFMMEMAAKHNIPILISDDAHFATPDEKEIQDVRLMGSGGSWRFATSYHRFSGDDARSYFKEYMKLPDAQVEGWMDNNAQWADRFKNFKLKYEPSMPTKFYPTDTLKHTFNLIQKHGRMDWKNEEMVSRLKTEIAILHSNGAKDLLPYFFPDEEVCSYYESLGLLTGVGRGSAAGLELAYLLGITHTLPMKWNLSLERFITPDRIQSGALPDIDQDLPDRSYLDDPETGFLTKRFPGHFAQMSTNISLKLRSTVKDIARASRGYVESEIHELAKKFEEPPQGISDADFVFGYKSPEGFVEGSLERDNALKEYIKLFPQDWAKVRKCLGLTRSKGRHPCAILISNVPVVDFIPMTSVGGVRVTSYTYPSVEACGGVKYDFLTINALKNISDTIKLLQTRVDPELNKKRLDAYADGPEKYDPKKGSITIDGKRVPLIRVIPFEGKHYDIWDLPDSQPVYRSICEGKIDKGVFQFGSPGALPWLKHFDSVKKIDANGEVHKAIDSIEDLSAFTALDRPGGLNTWVTNPENGEKHNTMVEFARRARGEAPIQPREVFMKLFPETYGLLVYQEQLQYAYQELTGCTGAEAEEYRRNVAKKKKEKIEAAFPFWMEKAGAKLGEAEAKDLWQTFLAWSEYGFNKSVATDTILCMSNGESKQIKDFVAGDKINGVDENGQVVENEVVAVHDHGELLSFLVEFDDGSTVETSIDHKFLTDQGMMPLHEIWSTGTEVLCVGKDDGGEVRTSDQGLPQARASQGVSCVPGGSCGDSASAPAGAEWSPRRGHAVRCDSPNSGNSSTQEGVSNLLRDQEGEHPAEEPEAQPVARAAGYRQRNGEEDLGSTGNPVGASGSDSHLAGSSSRGDAEVPGIGSQGDKSIKGRSVVTEYGDSHLGGGANSMRPGTETSGLREGQDLGGSGRVLPLLRAEECSTGETDFGDHSGARCDAECGSPEPLGRDAAAIIGGMLSNLGWEDGGGMVGMAHSDAPLASTGSLVRRKVVRVQPVGIKRMCDLEVSHPKHNFLLPNGVVTSNSHSICYSIIGYACAFLRKHYPLEWWAATLTHAKKDDIFNIYWQEAGKFISLPDIKLSRPGFFVRNGKIQAPLNLMMGIAEAVLRELEELESFDTLEAFIRAIETRKDNLATTEIVPTVLKKVTKLQKAAGYKVGDVIDVKKVKRGRSMLGRAKCYNLILAGAMESLFPEKGEDGKPLNTIDKLMYYEKVLAEVTGEKQKPIAKAYSTVTPMVQYQIRKQILPSYAEDLRESLPPGTDLYKNEDGDLVYDHEFFDMKTERRRKIRCLCVDGDELEVIENDELVGDSRDLDMVQVAYVSEAESWEGVSKTSQKPYHAFKLRYEVNGYYYEKVIFGRDAKLDDYYLKNDFTGAIVMVILRRKSGSDETRLMSVKLLTPPLNLKAEEEEHAP